LVLAVLSAATACAAADSATRLLVLHTLLQGRGASGRATSGDTRPRPRACCPEHRARGIIVAMAAAGKLVCAQHGQTAVW